MHLFQSGIVIAMKNSLTDDLNKYLLNVTPRFVESCKVLPTLGSRSALNIVKVKASQFIDLWILLTLRTVIMNIFQSFLILKF